MGIQVYRDISIDFSNSRYIFLNAKMQDSKSRFIRMTCTNVGQPVPLNPTDYSAFIRWRKSDGYSVFNKCVITTKSQIIFEMTEQMLAAPGTCYADIVILDVNKSDINNDATIISADGTIIENNGTLLSTMSFYVNVLEKPVIDSDIISANEFSALNDLLLRAETSYEALSNGVLEQANEYAASVLESKNAAVASATNASTSATNAHTSEVNANNYKTAAQTSATNAHMSEVNAKTSEDAAKISENNAKASEIASKLSEDNAKDSETNATTSATNAATSATNARTSELNAKVSEDAAKASEDNAKDSEINAETYSKISKSYAIGEGGYRNNESTDNSKYYYQQATQKALDAATSELNAKDSETNAATSATNAETSATNAATSATNARTSELNAKDSEMNIGSAETVCFARATLAQSYAVGGTGTRNGENSDNAKYYYQQCLGIATGLSGALTPMGTITFENLQNQTKLTGFMYNISNDFISDSTFKDGAGKKYPAGTNVYYTQDGYWDCLAGAVYSKSEIDTFVQGLDDRLKSIEDIVDIIRMFAIKE